MGAEESYLTGALADLKKDVKEGFDDVKGDLKELVTKGEFRAEVARIDQNHSNLKDAHNTHVTNTADQFKTLAANTRWTIGVSITVVGIAVGAIVKFIPA